MIPGRFSAACLLFGARGITKGAGADFVPVTPVLRVELAFGKRVRISRLMEAQ